MAELTNLTDRIAHLRDHKGSPPVANAPSGKPPRTKGTTTPGKERKFATDYFMLFVYGLLALALCAQMLLIVSLDLV